MRVVVCAFLKLLIERKPTSLPKSFLKILLSQSRYKNKPIIEEYLRQVIRDRYNVNIIYESIKDKLKGISDDDLKKSLGFIDDYISVKVWNPKNYIRKMTKMITRNPTYICFSNITICYIIGRHCFCFI